MYKALEMAFAFPGLLLFFGWSIRENEKAARSLHRPNGVQFPKGVQSSNRKKSVVDFCGVVYSVRRNHRNLYTLPNIGRRGSDQPAANQMNLGENTVIEFFKGEIERRVTLVVSP